MSYLDAKEKYLKYGIDTEKAIKMLGTPTSRLQLHAYVINSVKKRLQKAYV